MVNVRAGDPAPVFFAISVNNPNYAFDAAAGRNLILTFLGDEKEEDALLKKMASAPFFDDDHSSLFFVTKKSEKLEKGALPLRIPGVRAFYDDGDRIAELYGMSRFEARPVTFIISPRLQVLGIITAPLDKHADALAEAMNTVPSVIKTPPILLHAPVLIIPNVFEPDLCRKLIEGYKENGGRDSGFMRDVNGKTVEVKDKNHKVRRDWNIDEGNLTQLLQERIRTRVVPEIKKAFQFDVTRMERYLVACYTAEEGGHFRAHRDNTTKATLHRRFAVSLNLNAGEYDGGDLRFPEFGMQTYRPPSGGCCIFSCSLLHEATVVSKGERYAFLPFLYDESAKKIREENLKYLEQKIL